MPKEHKAIITKNSLVIHLTSGQCVTLLAEDNRFPKIRTLLLTNKWDEVEKELSLSQRADALNAKIKDDALVDKTTGSKTHPTLEKRVILHSSEVLAAFHKECRL